MSEDSHEGPPITRNSEDSPKKSLPSITIRRSLQEDFNWYWDTFPPTIAEKARAAFFFTSLMGREDHANFLTSAARFMQIPDSDLPEVAFVGRSNVGKSSLLNAILGKDGDRLARTSSTPGFTKTMNFYGIGPDGVRLSKDENNHDKIFGQGGLVIVDVPGYGEGSFSEWGTDIMKYIQSRKQLRRVFVLLDAEHGIKDRDRSILASLRLANVSHQVVLSKVDKIFIPSGTRIQQRQGVIYKNIKAKGSVEAVRKEMTNLKDEIQPPTGMGALGEILACSSETKVDGHKIGINDIQYAVLKAAGLDNPSTTRGRIDKASKNKKFARILTLARS